MNTVALASTNELKLRAVRLAVQSTKAERYAIHSRTTKSNLLIQTYGADQTIENAIIRGRAIRQHYADAICIGIENGISKLQNRHFDFAAIALFLPDEELPIITQSPALEIPKNIFDEVLSVGITHTTWGHILAEHFGGDSYDPHKILTQGKYSRIDSICAGLKLGLMYINWNRYPSSPPQPAAPPIV